MSVRATRPRVRERATRGKVAEEFRHSPYMGGVSLPRRDSSRRVGATFWAAGYRNSGTSRPINGERRRSCLTIQPSSRVPAARWRRAPSRRNAHHIGVSSAHSSGSSGDTSA